MRNIAQVFEKYHKMWPFVKRMYMIPYQPFAEHLKKLQVLASPSELQAHATGMLCVNQAMNYKMWSNWVINEYCVDGQSGEGLDMVLSAVFDFTKDMLNKDDYSFTLLLPEDEPSMSARLAVLSDWVTTFLSALGLAGYSGKEHVSKEVVEFVEDLDKIARVEQTAEDTEGEELDLMEIVEYVRTGVMMLSAELNQLKPANNTIN